MSIDYAKARIRWLLHHKINPDLPMDADYVACDGDEPIGRVYRIGHGPNAKRWMWAVTAVAPDPHLPTPVWGIADKRSEAHQRVAEVYQHLIADEYVH